MTGLTRIGLGVMAYLMSGAGLAADATRPRIPSAYHAIAQHERVPVAIWFALLQQESCRSVPARAPCLPWPWTLNIDGQGHYYRRAGEAALALRQALQQGRAVAIGPGQIYWPAHHDQFEHPERLLDIATNLAYSAAWLRTQYDIAGDWWLAVGRYHAPHQPTAAQHYRARVRQRWEDTHEAA